MTDTIINILITGIAFFIGGKILSGVELKDIGQSILVAIVVAVLDFTLGNVLRIVTLGLLSLGIFTWLLNAILIQVANHFLSGFHVRNFWWALGLAAIVGWVSSFLHGIF